MSELVCADKIGEGEVASKNCEMSKGERRAHNLKQALKLGNAGIYIFPSLNKVPLSVLWTKPVESLTAADRAAADAKRRENGLPKAKFYGCTNDPKRIETIWRNEPDATPSIACGPSGLACFDADFDKAYRADSSLPVTIDGPALSAAFFNENGVDLTDCPQVLSGSGARHFWFRSPGDIGPFDIKNLEVNVKIGGAQAVAPGSIRPNGRAYLPVEGTPDLIEAFKAGTIPFLPQCVLDRRPSKADVKVSDQELATLIAEMKTPDDDESAHDARLADLDIEGMRERRPDFAALLDGDASEGDVSGDRFNLLRHLHGEHGSGFTSKHGLSFMTEHAACGSFVGDASQVAGEFNLRNAAKDWARSRDSAIVISDGSEYATAADDEPEAFGYAVETIAKPAFNFGAPTAFTGMRLADTEDVEFVVYPSHPRSVVGGLIGHGGSLKTARTIVEALGIVTGRHDLLGLDSPADIVRTSVWLHNAEDEIARLNQRLAAAMLYFDIPDSALNGADGHRLFISSSANTQWHLVGLNESRKIVLDKQKLDAAVKFIKQNGIGFVVFDPLVELHGVEENDNKAMAKVFGAFRKIALQTGAHVLVVIHSGKPPQASIDSVVGNQHAARGASSQSGSMRFVRTLTGMSKTDAAEFGIMEKERSRYARQDDAKANLSAKRVEPLWFESVSIVPGPNRRSVLVSVPVKLAKGGAITENGIAELVAEVLSRPPFGPDAAYPLHDVMKVAKIGAEWKPAHRTTNLKRALFGPGKSTSCTTKRGVISYKGGAGQIATLHLTTGTADFGAVEGED